MHLSFKLLSLSLGPFLLTPLVFGGSEDHDGGHRCDCNNPLRRREWRTLTNEEKSQYIKSVQCLQHRPDITTFPGVKTRFDDFQTLHINLALEIHLVGQFLPWHRRFVSVYENALREECHYKGANPYWDWTKDVDTKNSIKQSPIFDPVHGFGGNGIYIPGYDGPTGGATVLPESGGGCITDGPFASYNLSVGPGTQVTINDKWVQYMTTAQVKNTTKQPTFELFRQEAGGAFKPPPWKIHDGGHAGVNGEMASLFSSPGDPIFYLHHGNLDRVWWIWQNKDPKGRLKDISGPTTQNPPYIEVTLNFELKLSNLAPLVTIRDVMDTTGELLCYVYE